MSNTTFSYAQAAKGQTISQPSPQLTSSSGPPSVKDDPATANTSVSAPSVTSNDSEVRDAEKKAKVDIEAVPSKLELEVTQNGVSGSSTASASTGIVRDADAPARGGQQSEDKSSRSTSRTSRANEGSDGRKARKGKKGRANEKDSHSNQTQDDEKEKEVPKPVLSEAPPPSVNIWEQRKELQAAKAKVTPVTQPITATSVSTPTQESSKDQTESVNAQEPVVNGNGVNGERPVKKSTDSAQPNEQVPRRSAPRGSRATERDDKTSPALPPVVDASSWPDPRAAAAVEESSRKVQDKAEAGEKEIPEESGATKKKTWNRIEINPSVVFNTPLPARSGKPRGGGRGGREVASTRGSHSVSSASAPVSAGDRAAVVNGSAGSKTGTTRPREGSMQSRTTSQPQPVVPQSAKPSSADSQTKDQRKQSSPVNGEQVREAGPEIVAVPSKRASSVRDIRTEQPGAFDSAPRANPQERPQHPHQKGSEHAGPHGQPYQARDGRPERGRGGYRGRGGHNGGSGSHVASGSYSQSGQFPINPFLSRQNSGGPSPPSHSGQYPVPYGQHSRGRGNRWAGSGQSTGRNGGAPFSPKPVQANDYGLPQYPPYMFPQQNDLMPVIRHQIEYYLSVENLCKDFYIRERMDSQGFVHLSTIAGFKRMQELVKDHETIRLACAFSDSLDYVMGEDNIERLRNRVKWQSFVLPYEQRNESARNEGPQNFRLLNQAGAPMHPYPGPVVQPMFPVQSPALYPGYSEDQMFQPVYGNGLHYEPTVNGELNGHHYNTETQLSAGVPEFSPPDAPITLESMTQISDNEVLEKLMVLDAGEQHDDHAHQGVNGATSSGVNGEDHSGGRPYAEIRREALEQRQNASVGETPKIMEELYKFWSKWLLDQFNGNVYTEFRELAMHDARKDAPSRCGLGFLLEFYDRLLMDSNGQKPWPKDRAVPDFMVAHFREAKDLDKSLAPGSDVAI
ncbi:hypothetical protein OQA88_6800 [Cercophora sp. LCS_1]